MSEDDDIRLAEEYCHGSLDERTRLEVERRALADPAFQQLLGETKTLLAGMQLAGRKDLMETMGQWNEDAPAKSTSAAIPMRTWTTLGIAASLIVALTYFFWPAQEAPSLALYKEFYQPYPNVVMPTVRGGHGDTSRMTQAYGLYDSGDFENARKLFSQLRDRDAAADFYAGQCALALDQIDEAILLFTRCITSEEPFAIQAQWYLSLAYLKQGNAALARESFERVVGMQNSYSPKADSILKRFR